MGTFPLSLIFLIMDQFMVSESEKPLHCREIYQIDGNQDSDPGKRPLS